MRAFIVCLTLALFPSFASAQGSSGNTAKAASAKKTRQGAASPAKTSGIGTLDLSALSVPNAQGTPPQAASPAPEDELLPLDVNNMLFDAHSIRQVVQHHMPQIQSCYEKVLSTSGQRIEGRVAVGFIIDITGSVLEARLLPKKSTVTDERVIDCVLLRVRRLIFPKPPDNRRYPIEFPFDLTVKK